MITFTLETYQRLHDPFLKMHVNYQKCIDVNKFLVMFMLYNLDSSRNEGIKVNESQSLGQVKYVQLEM